MPLRADARVAPPAERHTVLKRQRSACSRLVVNRIAGGTAYGWATGPDGTAGVTLRIGGTVLCSWPRTLVRPDVDAQFGPDPTKKGFAIPVGEIGMALALSAAANRTSAAICFADQRSPIPAEMPTAPSHGLTEAAHDVWLADDGHLRVRTKEGVRGVIAAQVSAGRLVRGVVEGLARESVVTFAIRDQFIPTIVVFATERGSQMATIAFPSLLRGGVHEAEGFANAPDRRQLTNYAFCMAQALTLAKPRVQLAIAPGRGTEAVRRPSMRRFLETHAKLADGPAALPVPPGALPTIAALAGACDNTAIVDVDGSERRTFLVKEVRHETLDRLSPIPPSPSLPDRAGRSPAIIMSVSGADEGLERLLYPLSPDVALADTPIPHAPPVTIVRSRPLDALPLTKESLPPDAVVIESDAAIPQHHDLAAMGRPVLFLDPAIVLHDPRTVAALAAFVAVPGIATAAPLLIREFRGGDLETHDRVVACGLYPADAGADEPWRPPLSPLGAHIVLPRRTVLVAANHPACVMVSSAVLHAHGGGLSGAEPATILALMARARAAGMAHAATTWFAAFDSLPERPPLPHAPLPANATNGVTRVRRLR